MATRKPTKERKKPKKQKGIKGNGYSNVPAGRTYPGTIMPFPDLPGTSRPSSY